MAFQRGDVVLVPLLKPVLFTLDPTRVLHQVGVLLPADLAEVNDRLRRTLEL